jgi:hypothetical protein
LTAEQRQRIGDRLKMRPSLNPCASRTSTLFLADLPGSLKDDNRHAVCHICNRLKSDLVFNTEEQCRQWLADAWRVNGYREADVHAIRYVGKSGELTFECVVETELAQAA